MRIMSFNANGLRSAVKNGFFDWFIHQNIDICCLQEVRLNQAHANKLKLPLGYELHIYPALKEGYSGVGILTRIKNYEIVKGLGDSFFDNEGRYMEIITNNLHIASAYFPSGTSGEIRQKIKYTFLSLFTEFLEKNNFINKNYILCSDINIAHSEIDLKNWQSNQKSSGFLPEERLWMDNLIKNMGFTDTFRLLHKDLQAYTWWSHRFKAREKNVGWRIDYQIISKPLVEKVRYAIIESSPFFSDHAPYIVEYEIL